MNRVLVMAMNRVTYSIKFDVNAQLLWKLVMFSFFLNELTWGYQFYIKKRSLKPRRTKGEKKRLLWLHIRSGQWSEGKEKEHVAHGYPRTSPTLHCRKLCPVAKIRSCLLLLLFWRWISWRSQSFRAERNWSINVFVLLPTWWALAVFNYNFSFIRFFVTWSNASFESFSFLRAAYNIWYDSHSLLCHTCIW